MTVPNPDPYAARPNAPVPNPAGPPVHGNPAAPQQQPYGQQPYGQQYGQQPSAQQEPQPFAQPAYAEEQHAEQQYTGQQYPQPYGQQPHAQQPHGQQPHAQQPYGQRPPGAQPSVPPVRDAGPPKPPRPPLTKAAAHRARLAGGVGGGIAWLGLGIAQLCATFLLLPVLVGAIVFGVGFAIEQDGTSATSNVWTQTLDWLASPWGVALAIGIPAGIVIALLGLWLSARMLRHPGLRRPVGVTWAGFGVAIAASVVLSGLGSVTLPFFGGVPFGDAFDVDMDGFDPGANPGAGDEEQVREWLSQGGGADLLERIADPGALLAVLGPWIALGQLLALVVPIAVSIFAWWWMAHAMRPAAVEAAHTDRTPGGTSAPAPSATDAGAAASGTASAT